jgi:hypothetical protein
MKGYITVQHFTNVAHVYMPTSIGPVVSVSLYGHDIGSYSDERLISLAREELKRKLDSEIFALVNVIPKESRLLCEDCMMRSCEPTRPHPKEH